VHIPKIILPAAAVLVSATIFSASAFAEDGPVIRENKEAKTVEIVIDGKTVGEFTKDGLTVHGDLRFTGVLTDIGPSERDGNAGDDEHKEKN